MPEDTESRNKAPDPSEGAYPDFSQDEALSSATERKRDAGLHGAPTIQEADRQPVRFNSTLVTILLGAFTLVCLTYALYSLTSDSDAPSRDAAEGAPAEQTIMGSETPKGVSEEDQQMNVSAFGGNPQASEPGKRKHAGEYYREPMKMPGTPNPDANATSNKPAQGEQIGRALAQRQSPYEPLYGPAVRGRPAGGPSAGSRKPSRQEKLKQHRQTQLEQALTSSSEIGLGQSGPSGKKRSSARSAASHDPYDPLYDPSTEPDKTVRGRTLNKDELWQNAYDQMSRQQESVDAVQSKRPPVYPGEVGSSRDGERGRRAPFERRQQAREQNQDFLRRIRWRGSQPNEVTTVKGPLPPYVLPKGTIIPIALESAVSSDLAGSIVARITADVRDRTKEHVLIPAGTEIVSDYGAPSAVGQNRLLVAATRMNLPDGRYVNFRNARATGASGRSGMQDKVDRHLLSRFGAVSALAVLGTVVNASTRSRGFGTRIPAASRDSSSGGVVIYPPGAGYGGFDYAGDLRRSFAQQINQVLGEMLSKQVNRQPTIKLRAGLQGRLLLGEDLNMRQPYYEDGSDFDRLSRKAAAYRASHRDR